MQDIFTLFHPPVDPMLIVLASDPEYGSELNLFCRGFLSTKMYSHLIPYMSVMWSTPLEETIGMEEMIGNGASFSLNLTIPSLNESHNGVYFCHLLIVLPNNTATISRQVEYTIDIRGIVLLHKRHSFKCCVSKHSFKFCY